MAGALTIRTVFDGRGAFARRLRAGISTSVLAALLVALPAQMTPVFAAQVKGEATATVANGFARIVFNLTEEVDAEVRAANGIVVIAFKRPIGVAVEQLAAGIADYVSVVRRDPDNNAVRFALKRKVTVNTMAAGERLYVDLLPEGWAGLPPGLPQEVVEDLARRAREAEAKLKQQQKRAVRKQAAPVRVRVAAQPTFTRYTFELPELIGTQTDRVGDAFAVMFDAPLTFDLADAKAALPATVAAIEAAPGEETATVRFRLADKADLRTFREDNAFVVDVTPANAKMSDAEPAAPTRPAELAAILAAKREIEGARQASPERATIANVPTPPRRPANLRPSAPVAGADKKAEAVAGERPAATPPAAAVVRPEPAAVAEIPPAQSLEVAEARVRAYTPASVAREVKPAAARSPAPEPPPATPRTVPAMALAKTPVHAVMQRQGDTIRLVFPFRAPTSAAVFRRVDTVWLVFDSADPIDVEQLRRDQSRTIRTIDVTRSGEGQAVRLTLERPRLSSFAADGESWVVTLGNSVLEPTTPLAVARVASPDAGLSIPFAEPRRLHRLDDPDAGDRLLVVTGFAPARGFVKAQDFVEFRALASTHGVVIEPLADDVSATLDAETIVIGRPGGLTITAGQSKSPGAIADRAAGIFDAGAWTADREAPFVARQTALLHAAADAPEVERANARFDLARFYVAREMYPEAKAVLDTALAADRTQGILAAGLILRAASNILMGRAEAALKDLGHAAVSAHYATPLWRALAYAGQGRFAEANEALKACDAIAAEFPPELQRVTLKEAARSAIEVGDLAEGARRLNEFDGLGVPREMKPAISLLSGRLAEKLGRPGDAMSAYRAAAAADDPAVAAQARLRDVVLRYSIRQLMRPEAQAELESLTAGWRGDATENEALQMLARVYAEDGRYRDALQTMRVAQTAFAGTPTADRTQDEAAATFEALFLGDRADSLPPIDALALFYDFRTLTPIGRRGDEMIRRLAERLISVDLLAQASELLQHQVDHRLQGAARAQVSTRLAVVYLMNRRPDRALNLLRTSRAADLPNELRSQRLLVEARALSDTGRHDVALEVIGNLDGRETERLRADIHWAARRWRMAAEQIERLYGERWREFRPLDPSESADMLRAAVGYALADDVLGLDRFRQKYAPKLADGPERRMFDVITAPQNARGDEFRDIARAASTVDTLSAFLRDLRARYPDTGVVSAAAQPPRG